MVNIQAGQEEFGRSEIEIVLETAQFRYIRFGPKGSWAAKAIEDGLLLLGHKEVPHELVVTGDKRLIADHVQTLGKLRNKASDFAREISDFYHLGADTVWITFHNGRLYWTIAEGEVTWLGADNPIGARSRRVRFPWRNTDLKGAPLIEDHLSSLLTKVTAYQQTLCRVDAHYLRRILTGHKDPDVLSAQQALSTLTANAVTLIGKLHQDDFETLVGILLERQGYHRASRIGGTQKDVDMVVEHSFTGERLFVQVKSSATQRVLDDYVRRFDETTGFARLIFAVHTLKKDLNTGPRTNVDVWDREKLATAVVNAGLVNWLTSRAG